MGQIRVSRLRAAAVVAFAFISGYVLSTALNNAFDYNNELALADIINVVATCAVMIFAAWYLSKKLNEDRYAKELAISDLKEIEENISAIISQAQNTTNGIDPIMPLVNRLHTLLERLGRTCKINGTKVSTEGVMNKFLCFYGCATNYGDDPINLPKVMMYGEDLIVEIRNTIATINQM